MRTQSFLLHALSPLHAGTGQAMDLIDLPIARYASTGMPFVPGSSLKGVLRDARSQTLEGEVVRAVFGPDDDPSAHAGAISLGDARLLALPVRSFRGTFAWVTSPLLLHLARRDLGTGLGGPAGAAGAVLPEPIPDVANLHALVADGNVVVHERSKRVYLEEIDREVATPTEEQTRALESWIALFQRHLDLPNVGRRLVVVDDETMTYLWETATQVDQRVRIDAETRTVAKGALWMEESLPPETLLLGLLAADRSRHPKEKLTAEQVLTYALEKEEILQFGGKATVGRGRCRMVPIRCGAESGTAGAGAAAGRTNPGDRQ